MTDRGSFPDEESRIAATTTFDRNVIVIAGAGTGSSPDAADCRLELHEQGGHGDEDPFAGRSSVHPGE